MQRGSGGDFEITAVIPDAADQSKPTSVDLSVNPYLKLLDALEESRESGGPVGQLPRGVLQAGASCGWNLGTE